MRLRVGCIVIALGAGAHNGSVGGGEGHLGLLLHLHLAPGIDDAADETKENGRHAAKGDGSVEEDETTDGNGQLVEGSNHGVGGRGGDTDAPGGGVRDENGAETRVDHAEHQAVARLDREVAGQILTGPVLEKESEDNNNGDGQEVVVEHGLGQVSIAQ